MVLSGGRNRRGAAGAFNGCRFLFSATLLVLTYHQLATTIITNIIPVEASQDLLTTSQQPGDADAVDVTSLFTRLYKITWNGPFNGQAKALIESEPDEDNVINIATKSNERYTCIVPSDNRNQLNFDTSARNSSSSSSSQGDRVKTPIHLLEPLLKGNYCSYKFELFWIYELCHGKFLRQYHEENAKYKAKVTQEYFLGRMEEQTSLDTHVEEYERQMAELERTGQPRPTILVNGHHKPYVQFNMTSGTKCDLTKNSRVARIIYVCNEEPSLELYSIKEISTCEYEAIVLSPHLCQHKDFKVGTTTQYEIQCYSRGEAPRRPKKTIDFEAVEDEETDRVGEGGRNGKKRRGVAYLQGRTLIIDADLLLS